MASVTLNPMFMSVSGRLGKIVYYTRWKNSYARIYVKARNPRTEAQQRNRNLFSEAMKSWQGLSDEEKTAWNRRAKKLPMTGHNLYISRYMKADNAADKPAGIDNNQNSSNCGTQSTQKAISSVTPPSMQGDRLYTTPTQHIYPPGAG